MAETEPIRVAHIVGKVCLSGVDTIIMEYYRNIDRSKVQFDFIMDGYNETPVDQEIKRLGGQVYKVEPYEQNMLNNIRQCEAIFRDNDYKIVHSHLNTLSVFPLFAAWRAKVPIRIAHNHSTAAKGEGKRTVLKYMLRPFARLFATHYCACSAYAGKWLFGEKFYNSGKVHLIKNAINIDKFAFDEQVRKKVRRKLNIDQKFVVGHVGRFVYQKNHEFLIDIFAEVYKRNKNALLMLVGSGELEQAIKEKVNSLGLSDSVLFLGTRTDVADLMQAMDVFILPSHYEGLGIVAIEAQAAGLKTIVSEAIPEEAKITKLLEYCRLDQLASVWAEKTLVCCRNETYERRTQYGELEQAGYDIKGAAKELSEWYEGIASRS